ncbi:MAG: RNA polymerase sigma factor [Mediterranea sp.]|jgi:RNA polymerase sigma-70 factor (ECF subfamily)|nr:RNA polymerase sigma factor [Mediterranea sp.]
MEKVEFTQGILAMEKDLHRFAYKLTANHDSANDLVQDCVLHALDNHEKFTYAKNLKGWMYTLMRNIFINNYRRTVREMNIIDDNYSLSSNQQLQIEDEEGDRFEFAYDMKQLYKVIHTIPDDIKVPFQMFVAGFKYREIAEKLGLPMGTVKSRLFFIRKRLKEELKDFS